VRKPPISTKSAPELLLRAISKPALVAVPASLPYLFAAAKLAVPRALLGVMIAEWLATGGGLGDLLNRSRGYLDYGMIWSVAFVSVVLSIVLYRLVVLAERLMLSKSRWTRRERLIKGQVPHLKRSRD